MTRRGLPFIAAAALSLSTAGSAAGAPADFSGVTKFIEAHTDQQNPTREYRLLAKPRGRVLGRCITRTFTNSGTFRVNCRVADGSIFSRGKVEPVWTYSGFNRITGGTGAYDDASGRLYREVDEGFSDVYFDFPPLDPTKPDEFGSTPSRSSQGPSTRAFSRANSASVSVPDSRSR